MGRTAAMRMLLPMAALTLAVFSVAADFVCATASPADGAPARAFRSAREPLRVGPGERFTRPSEAAAVARDGDTVLIAAGRYDGDVCAWRANDLTIRGAGAERTILDACGKACMGKGIWVICGTNATIEGVSFRGAACRDRNGAGIRLDADGDLTVRRCIFEKNENGILTGAHGRATVTIEQCRFTGNGAGDGYSHNLYIGAIRRLVFRHSASDHAVRGHNLKSRAYETEILDSVFDDGEDGISSYLVDCPNGGRVTMKNCRLVQSPDATNGTMVSLGEEGAYPGSLFAESGNVYMDRRKPKGRQVELTDVVRADARSCR